jgi:hypothetical protein
MSDSDSHPILPNKIPGDASSQPNPDIERRLARLSTEHDLETRMRMDIDSFLNDKLLARDDPGAALVRKVHAIAELGLPAPSEIDAALSRQESAALQSTQNIEQLFLLDRLGDIAVEGVLLNELLNRDGASGEERLILKRGMLLLKHRKYAEAAEWWRLNRPPDTLTDRRLFHLLTLLLALTYRLAGDEASSQGALREADRSWILGFVKH